MCDVHLHPETQNNNIKLIFYFYILFPVQITVLRKYNLLMKYISLSSIIYIYIYIYIYTIKYIIKFRPLHATQVKEKSKNRIETNICFKVKSFVRERGFKHVKVKPFYISSPLSLLPYRVGLSRNLLLFTHYTFVNKSFALKRYALF